MDRAVVGCCGHQLEIDLFFETIDFCDLHFQAITELDDTAAAASDEMGAGGVELEEVVLQGGQRDQAAHPEIGDFDEETKVAHVNDEAGIGLRRA